MLNSTIYWGFESILAPENYRMQNPKKSYPNKYQNHVVSSYDYK